MEEIVKAILMASKKLKKVGGELFVKEFMSTPGLKYCYTNEDVDKMFKDLLNCKNKSVADQICAELFDEMKKTEIMRGIVTCVWKFYIQRYFPWVDGRYILDPVIHHWCELEDFCLRVFDEQEKLCYLTIPLDAIVERNPNLIHTHLHMNAAAATLHSKDERSIEEKKVQYMYEMGVEKLPEVKEFYRDLACPPAALKESQVLFTPKTEKVFRMWDKEKKRLIYTADEYALRVMNIMLTTDEEGKKEGDLLGFGEFDNKYFVYMEGVRRGSTHLYEGDIIEKNKGFCTAKRGVLSLEEGGMFVTWAGFEEELTLPKQKLSDVEDEWEVVGVIYEVCDKWRS